MVIRTTNSRTKARTTKKPVAKRVAIKKRVTAARRTATKTTTRRTANRKAPAKRTTAARRTVARRATTKKPIARRIATRKAPARTKVKSARRVVAKKRKIGVISHYFDRIGVAVVETKSPIQKGDRVSIEGPITNFKQKTRSMQHNHKQIEKATRGRSIGLKVNRPVRKKDIVYRIGE